MFGEAPLSNESIRRALSELWSLQVSRIAYAPVGYGSYHWRATNSDGAELFVTADRAGAGDVAPLAYRVVRRLADIGLRFVRAPVRHRGSDVTWEVDGCWISVWPWLHGRTGSALYDRATDDLEATARSLRVLHDHGSITPEPGLVEDWAMAGRLSLFALLARKAEEWEEGPYTPEVQSRLSWNRASVLRQFRRYDDLVESVLVSDVELVITHGEPHAGNVVHTDEGLMLIDWDTLRWAPRERDLWALDGSMATCLWRGCSLGGDPRGLCPAVVVRRDRRVRRGSGRG